MSPYDITLEYLSNAYMVDNFKEDNFMENRLFTQFRKTAVSKSSNTFLKIRSQYLTEINAQAEETITINIILIVLIAMALLAIFIISLRAEQKIRTDEQKVLAQVVSCNYQEELIDSSKAFLSNITKEEVRIIKNDFADTRTRPKRNEETSFAPDVTVNDRENMKS